MLSHRSTLRQKATAHLALLHRCVSTRPTLSLAYDLHEPSKQETRSDAAPIIFLHGLFGSKKNNRSISKAIARDLGRPVYALDLRNHGESPHEHQHDYMSMADDVAGFVNQHSLQAPTLIGHSMGAKTAMTLALRSPNLVRDLVSVDNAPVDAVLATDFAKYIRGMKKVEEAKITRQAQADDILKDYESVTTPPPTKPADRSRLWKLILFQSLPIRQFLLGNLYRPEQSKTQRFRVPLGTLAGALNHLGDFPYKDPAAVRFEKPALFIRGTQSKYVPDDVLPLIGQFFPKFRLADVDAGHWVISENPESFRKAVVNFLRDAE